MRKGSVASCSIKQTKFCMIYLYWIKQIDSMLPCVSSVLDHRRRQKCGKNIRNTGLSLRLPIFLFLLHFDVICDQILNI